METKLVVQELKNILFFVWFYDRLLKKESNYLIIRGFKIFCWFTPIEWIRYELEEKDLELSSNWFLEIQL